MSELSSITNWIGRPGEWIELVHPGEIVRAAFLEPLGMSVNALALALRVPAPRINDVARGKRAISAETAPRLAHYFGTSSLFWMNLQGDYDLRRAAAGSGEPIKREIEPLPVKARPKPPSARFAGERDAATAPTRRSAPFSVLTCPYAADLVSIMRETGARNPPQIGLS